MSAPVFLADCHTRVGLDLFTNTWTPVVLHALRNGPRRPRQLRDEIGGISAKVLNETLRRLERRNLVSRHPVAEVPPRVDYRLTELGESLLGPIDAIGTWVTEYAHELGDPDSAIPLPLSVGRGRLTDMTLTGRLELVALDATDIEGLAAFYAELTGWQTVRKVDGWITLRASDGQELGFQQVAEHCAPQWPGQDRPQQVHLDLQVDGHEAAAERAVALGATRLAEGASWITLADPAGHPFDLCQQDGVGPELRLFAATFDAPDTTALARFYADLLGMAVTYDGPEGALVAGDGKSLMFQRVSDYTPPRWPDPAHPQQGHLDIVVEDPSQLKAVAVRAQELGATWLADGASWITLADPAGHPFDLSA